MTASTEDGDRAYVDFVRRLLDDLAAGRNHPAGHYVELFPACADRIRAELPAEAPGAPPPPRVGPYEVTGELRAGGMGRLLLAQHPQSGAKLVIKMARTGLEAGDAHVLDRLKREATILGRMNHDGICHVLDVVSEGRQVFVVMPFIDGETLEVRINRASARVREGGPRSAAWHAIASPSHPGSETPSDGLRAVLSLMADVARAVHAAHEQGIVHRDLKPGNIMVRGDGHPVVLDFGLAVDLSDHEARRLTAHGELLGTPSYMAPEQIKGDNAAVDRRTDVYALGVILYECLTLKRAFKATGAHAITHRILSGRAERPRNINPAIPRDLESVCTKAMEAEPHRRHATALAFAEAVGSAPSSEAEAAAPISGFRRLLRSFRRRG